MLLLDYAYVFAAPGMAAQLSMDSCNFQDTVDLSRPNGTLQPCGDA